MTDRHMRILRHVARHTQRELEHHHAVDHANDAAATRRQDHLEHAARRTRGQVAAAELRRQASPSARKARP